MGKSAKNTHTRTQKGGGSKHGGRDNFIGKSQMCAYLCPDRARILWGFKDTLHLSTQAYKVALYRAVLRLPLGALDLDLARMANPETALTLLHHLSPKGDGEGSLCPPRGCVHPIHRERGEREREREGEREKERERRRERRETFQRGSDSVFAREGVYRKNIMAKRGGERAVISTLFRGAIK